MCKACFVFPSVGEIDTSDAAILEFIGYNEFNGCLQITRMTSLLIVRFPAIIPVFVKLVRVY